MTNTPRQQIQNAYDTIADTYHEKTSGTETQPEQQAILKEFLSETKTNAQILDAGCGGDPFTTANTTTIGVDFSKQQLLHDTTSNAHLTQGDMTQLPFHNNKFDAATAFYSFIHIPLEHHTTVLNELSRVLKPDSPLLFVEGTEQWVGENSSWLDTNQTMHWEMAGREQTIQDLEDTGYTITQITPVRDTLGDADGTKLFFLATT